MKRISLVLIVFIGICIIMVAIAQLMFVEANPIEWPTISVISPEEKTYQNTTIPIIISVHIPTGVNYSLHTGVAYIYYSLDGKSNHTLTISPGISEYTDASGILSDLTEGNHILDVYVNLLNGRQLSIQKTFTVNTTYTGQILKIVSPLNGTYWEDSIRLRYEIESEVIRAHYVLDGSNLTQFTGNSIQITGLSDGSHKLTVVVFTEDNVVSSDVYFNINATRTDTSKATSNPASNFPMAIILAVGIVLAVILVLAVISYKRMKNG